MIFAKQLARKGINKIFERVYSHDFKQIQEVQNFLIKGNQGCRPSFIYGESKNNPQPPSKRLLSVGLDAVKHAFGVELETVGRRLSEYDKQWVAQYPGEHYKLLAGMIKTMNPKLIVEIGTYTGASALVMKEFAGKETKVVTYDIIPWNQIKDTSLTSQDFDERFEQRIGDLAQKDYASTQMETLSNAEFIFIDAGKDGKMEYAFRALLDSIQFKTPPIVFFDDIRFLEMIPFWSTIQHPKLDLTSFGHWSGSGIVDWK